MASRLDNFAQSFKVLVPKNNFKTILKWLVYLAPIALLIWFVSRFSVNVPYWDQWSLVNLFDKVGAGSASFGDFFAQHNEHRIFFPKIIFVILAFASKWNIRIEIYFSIFLAIVTFFLIYKIAKSSSNSHRNIFHVFNILSCFFLFSLVQVGNWMWGFQIPWFLTNTSVTLAVFVLTVPKKLSPNLRLSLSALCCFIASFSLGHGLFSWLAVIPSVVSVEGNAKQRKIRLLLWSGLFALSFLAYNVGSATGNHPDIFFFFKEPLATIKYFLVLLGTPIINNEIAAASISGFIILLSFILFNIYYVWKYCSDLASNYTPWLSIGWFAIIFALITSVGRAVLGIGQAATSRYTTVSILLIVSILQMWRLLILSYQKSWFGKNAYWLSCFTAGILLLFLFFNSSNSVLTAQNNSSVKTGAKTCLEVIHFLDKSFDKSQQNCLKILFPQSSFVKAMASSLERMGFRDFPQDIKFTPEPDKVHGYIESPPISDQPLTLSRRSDVRFLGWAILPERRQQPRVVLFSYGDNQSFFADARVNLNRPDVAKVLKSNRYTQVGWGKNILLSSLPLGETAIQAWVYDKQGKQFVKLKGEVRVNIVN